VVDNLSLKCALLTSLAALGGCAGMGEGPIPVSQSTSTELSALRAALQNECLDVSDHSASQQGSQHASPSSQQAEGSQQASPGEAAPRPQADQARRNELVTAFMTAADLSYNQYERDLLAFSRQNDLGGALANQLLSAIGAASGSQALSRATNITTGAVTGTQSAFAKSLLNQTVSVLQTHMRAQRANQYALIVARLNWPYASWNICMAFSDALAYEQSGTLNAALAAMAASATDQERRGELNAQQAIRHVVLATDPLASALNAYLNPADEGLGNAHRDAARAIIRDKNILADTGLDVPERYSMIVYDGDRVAERLALVRELVARDSAGAASLRQALNQ
jgi:hypothetical protein